MSSHVPLSLATHIAKEGHCSQRVISQPLMLEYHWMVFHRGLD